MEDTGPKSQCVNCALLVDSVDADNMENLASQLTTFLIPGVFFLQEVVLVHILKDCSSKMTTLVYVLSALVATSAMAYGFCVEPLIFYFPANILGLSLIGVKVSRK